VAVVRIYSQSGRNEDNDRDRTPTKMKAQKRKREGGDDDQHLVQRVERYSNHQVESYSGQLGSVKETWPALPGTRGIWYFGKDRYGINDLIILKDWTTDNELWVAPCSFPDSPTFSPSSNKVTACSSSKAGTILIKYWDLNTGNAVVVAEKVPSSSTVATACNSPIRPPQCTMNHCGNRLAVLYENTLEVWDLETLANLFCVTAMSKCIFSWDDARLFSYEPGSKLLVVWDSQVGHRLLDIQFDSLPYQVIAGQVSRLCCVRSTSGIEIWDTDTGVQVFAVLADNLKAVCLGNDDSRVYACTPTSVLYWEFSRDRTAHTVCTEFARGRWYQLYWLRDDSIFLCRYIRGCGRSTKMSTASGDILDEQYFRGTLYFAHPAAQLA
jgi:hypothetical protein